MSALQERIKERRTALGFTLLQLSELLGVKEATVQRYESGEIKNIKHETIVALAEILKCSPQYLMGWSNKLYEDEDLKSNVVSLPQQNIYMRPVYNSVAAGFGAIAQDTIVEYMPTYINCSAEQELYFWVNVTGDSMSPLIDDGSKILIKKQTSIDSGQIAVVLIDGEDAVVKKVKYGDNWIELQSINPYYPPRRFENADVQKIQILGLVKEVSKTLQ